MPDDDMASEREFNEHNIEEFRRNGGKVGGQFEGFPLLLLTSTGAKSGDRARQPGRPTSTSTTRSTSSAPPRAATRAPPGCSTSAPTPTSSVEIGSDPPRAVVANELPRDERDRVYAIVKERAPGFAEYEKRTDRVIPSSAKP